MTNSLLKQLTVMQNQINETIRRVDNFGVNNHLDNADQISDLQDMMIEQAYEKTLEDLDI